MFYYTTDTTLNVYIIFYIWQVLHIFFDFFGTPEISFTQLQSRIYLTIGELFIALGPPVSVSAQSHIIPCLYSSALNPMFPLFKDAVIIPGVYSSALHRYASHQYLILHKVTTFC